jgi:hypothetical protein
MTNVWQRLFSSQPESALKQWMQPLPSDQIPVVEAYGKSVVAAKDATE